MARTAATYRESWPSLRRHSESVCSLGWCPDLGSLLYVTALVEQCPVLTTRDAEDEMR